VLAIRGKQRKQNRKQEMNRIEHSETEGREGPFEGMVFHINFSTYFYVIILKLECRGGSNWRNMMCSSSGSCRDYIGCKGVVNCAIDYRDILAELVPSSANNVRSQDSWTSNICGDIC
jgi:hypothetical protein